MIPSSSFGLLKRLRLVANNLARVRCSHGRIKSAQVRHPTPATNIGRDIPERED